jgi:hypothetical protein
LRISFFQRQRDCFKVVHSTFFCHLFQSEISFLYLLFFQNPISSADRPTDRPTDDLHYPCLLQASLLVSHPNLVCFLLLPSFFLFVRLSVWVSAAAPGYDWLASSLHGCPLVRLAVQWPLVNDRQSVGRIVCRIMACRIFGHQILGKTAKTRFCFWFLPLCAAVWTHLVFFLQSYYSSSQTGARNLSEWNLSESLFFTKPESFRIESFRKESFRMESFRSNLSENTFRPNWNLSEWNLSEGIFQKIFSAKPESFRMESFRRNLSENIFSKTGIFQNGIFQKESFRIDFLAKPESFRIESFRRNLSENIFSKTGIFQNGIIQKESFRKYFQQNWNLSE